MKKALLFSVIVWLSIQAAAQRTIITAMTGEVIANETFVYVDQADGKAYKADISDAEKQAVGFVITGAASGDFLQIFLNGVIEISDTTLIPGKYYFLSTTPGAYYGTQVKSQYQQLFKAVSDREIFLDIKATISDLKKIVYLEADVVNNNAVANTLQDVTGLSFSVKSGQTYYFHAFVPFSAAVATTGCRWTINTPTTTALSYYSSYPLTATSSRLNYNNIRQYPTASGTSSLTVGNIAIVEGYITPLADGVVQLQFASEIASSAITAKAGAYFEYWKL